MLCSGGVGRAGPSEASVMVEVLTRQGLAAERLILDEASLDTLQSVAVAARTVLAQTLARGDGDGHVVAVSDDYHLPRIRLLLAMLGVPSIAGPRTTGWLRGPVSHRLGMGLREGAAIPYDLAIAAVRRRQLLS